MHGHVQPRIGHITFNAKFLDRRLESSVGRGYNAPRVVLWAATAMGVPIGATFPRKATFEGSRQQAGTSKISRL